MIHRSSKELCFNLSVSPSWGPFLLQSLTQIRFRLGFIIARLLVAYSCGFEERIFFPREEKKPNEWEQLRVIESPRAPSSTCLNPLEIIHRAKSKLVFSLCLCPVYFFPSFSSHPAITRGVISKGSCRDDRSTTLCTQQPTPDRALLFGRGQFSLCNRRLHSITFCNMYLCFDCTVYCLDWNVYSTTVQKSLDSLIGLQMHFEDWWKFEKSSG